MRAFSTTPCSSQFERPGGWVETTISSAGKVRSASSSACSGSPSPISPRALTPASREPGEALVETLLRGRPRAVLVRRPGPKLRVERGADEEDVLAHTLRLAAEELAQLAAADGLVGDDEDLPGRPAVLDDVRLRRPLAHPASDREERTATRAKKTASPSQVSTQAASTTRIAPPSVTRTTWKADASSLSGFFIAPPPPPGRQRPDSTLVPFAHYPATRVRLSSRTARGRTPRRRR